MIPAGMGAIPFGNMTIPIRKMAWRIGKMIFPAGNPATSSGYITAPVMANARILKC
jgi:hypothetical protein